MYWPGKETGVNYFFWSIFPYAWKTATNFLYIFFNSFVPRVPYSVPGFLLVYNIWQPGVQPMSYTHIFSRINSKFCWNRKCFEKSVDTISGAKNISCQLSTETFPPPPVPTMAGYYSIISLIILQMGEKESELAQHFVHVSLASCLP